MDVKATIKGQKQIERDIRAYVKKVDNAVEKRFWKWALLLASDAQRHAPVETGMLRASIHGEVAVRNGNLVGAYGTNEKHGPFVEFGTNRIEVGTAAEPRESWPTKEATATVSPETMPYIRPAWRRHKDDLLKDLKAIGEEVK